MGKSVPALVKPELLVWARESIGYEVSQVAQHLDVPETTVVSWERGDGENQLTVGQLRKLAELYKRPLGVFYLPHPPRAFDAMRYFRKRPGERKPEPSPRLAIQIRDAGTRREIALDLAEVLGETPEPIPFRAAPGDSPTHWARKAREWLRVTDAEQASWRDEYEAYRSWRASLERVGVLVFQVSKVDEEVRGFSIEADRYPVIATSARDAPRARIFTLFHELGHLLLGRGELDENEYWRGSDATEVFCNEFAAQLLVPGEALDRELGTRSSGPAIEVDRDLAKILTSKFWVSEEVILLRLVNTGRLARSAYERRREELSHLRPTAKKKVIVPVPRKTVQSLGRMYVRSVLAAAQANHITLSDVAGYLGVRLKHLPAIERLVAHAAGAQT